MVGYSRLIEQNEEDRRARLRSLHAEVIDPRITTDGGRIVKTPVDGILVEIGSVARRSPNYVSDRVNGGDVIVEGDDIYNDGVNVAARLEGLCRLGEVNFRSRAY